MSERKDPNGHCEFVLVDAAIRGKNQVMSRNRLCREPFPSKISPIDDRRTVTSTCPDLRHGDELTNTASAGEVQNGINVSYELCQVPAQEGC